MSSGPGTALMSMIQDGTAPGLTGSREVATRGVATVVQLLLRWGSLVSRAMVMTVGIFGSLKTLMEAWWDRSFHSEHLLGMLLISSALFPVRPEFRARFLSAVHFRLQDMIATVWHGQLQR